MLLIKYKFKLTLYFVFICYAEGKMSNHIMF